MWQGNLVIKNQKSIANKILLLTLFYPLLVTEHEEIWLPQKFCQRKCNQPSKIFSFKGWHEQKTGSRLPGTPPPIAKQSFRELPRPPQNSGRTMDEEPEENAARWVDRYQQHGNKRRDRQEDQVERKPQQHARKFPVREDYPTTSELPPEKCRTKNIKKGNPQEWIGVRKFFPKVQGVWNTPCKKKPMGRCQPHQ